MKTQVRFTKKGSKLLKRAGLHILGRSTLPPGLGDRAFLLYGIAIGWLTNQNILPEELEALIEEGYIEAEEIIEEKGG